MTVLDESAMSARLVHSATCREIQECDIDTDEKRLSYQMVLHELSIV
jgi:hypothetical protein